MEYSSIINVHALSTIPGAVYELDLHGEKVNVRFRHEDAPIFSATPVLDKRTTDPESTQKFNNIKIKLMEV